MATPEIIQLHLLHPDETARLRTALLEAISISPRDRERFASYHALLDRLEQTIRRTDAGTAEV